jgi:hypothetical protein
MDKLLMRKLIMRRSLLAVALWLAFLAPAVAQFGHPIGQTSYPATVAPPAGFALVNHNSSTSGGGSTSQTTTVAATVAGHGEIVGLSWCADSGCSGTPTDATTSVVIGSGTCTEIAGTFGVNPGIGHMGAASTWKCSGIPAGQTACSATFPGTVYYLSVLCSEWSPSISACEVGNTANNISTDTLSIVTNGNVSAANELIYSNISSALGDSVTPGQTTINSNITSAQDEYQLGTSSGVTYTNTWTSAGTYLVGTIAACKP